MRKGKNGFYKRHILFARHRFREKNEKGQNGFLDNAN